MTAATLRIQGAQALHQQAAPRVADQFQPPPGRPRRGDAHEQADVGQLAADALLLGLGHRERDPGQPHPLQPALEHRRHPIEPTGIDGYPALGPAQGVYVRRDARDVARRVAEVGLLLLEREHRVEPLGVEVDASQLVSCRTQGLAGHAVQRRAVAVGVGVAEDNQQAHGVAAACGTPAISPEARPCRELFSAKTRLCRMRRWAACHRIGPPRRHPVAGFIRRLIRRFRP